MRLAGLCVALVGALIVLLTELAKHDPIQKWLVWRYAQYWLFALSFSAVCLSGGFAVMKALGLAHLRLRELFVISMATGVLVFFLGMFLGGILGLYGVAFAVAWPLLEFAIGARPLYRYLRRAWPHLRGARRRARRLDAARLVATALGALGLILVYASICTPDAASWDSRWYHLALPEHYAIAGGIRRSPEGWFHTALPQLASLVYLWPYLFKWLSLFDQVELAAHLEFVLLLWTLASIAPAVRYLVPRANATTTWAVFFLFSGIFVYDSSLNIGADHIAAFWAIPIWLMLARAWRLLDVRSSIALGAMLAGAINTKVQCVALVIFPCIALGVRGVIALARRSHFARHAWLTPFVTATSLAVLTTPYWLKNLIWYGDPLYPALYRHLKLRPWNEDMNYFYVNLVERNFWRPEGTTWEKAKQTFEAVFTFAFEPHDWSWMHGNWPVFGFLFSLSWFALPFVGTRRVWAIFIAGHIGVMSWFLFSHQDRYLQMLVPWMVACVAAVIILIWRLGWFARVPLLGLIGVQVVWGFASSFIQVPDRIATPFPMLRVMSLIESGYKKEYENRSKLFPEFVDAGNSTPVGSKILLHRMHMHAGLRRLIVMDHPNWQGLISYRRLGSERAVFELYERLGVTHVMWEANQDTEREETLASDLRFWGFVTHVTGTEHRYGKYLLAPVPTRAPADTRDTVLMMACSGYEPGLYEIGDLVMPPVGPPAGHPSARVALTQVDAEHITRLADKANYVVLSSCRKGFALEPAVSANFVARGRRGDEQLLVRKKPLLP